METTPIPPRSVLYRAYFICLILILSQLNSLFSQGGSMDGIIFGSPVGTNLLVACGGGPCDADRWTGGAAWNAACPNSSCLIDDGPSANGGIVRCGNSAETQSNIGPNSCYDPAVFTASLGSTCFDPNTGSPVSLTLPLVDQQVLWFNFDVRAFAGGYDFQVIGGNEDVAWILYYSNNPQCCVGGFNPGLSGNCNSLTYYACGTSFNNWAAQSFTTPIFDLTTNVYLLVWDQGFSKGDVSSDDFSINFKARYGCGENCSFLTNGQPVITCQPNGNYTVFQNVVGTSTTVTVTAPGSISIVTNPDPLVFTDLDPGPPPNVNSGTVTVTYASGVNYNITMTPTGTGTTCNPITLSGTAPDCCVPPTCTITGPTPVCPSSTNVYCGPVGAAAYSWSVTGGGTINGATNEQCVTVTSSGSCNTTYTLTLLAGATDCQSTCNYTVTVSDSSVPSITCPANVTIQCSDSSAPGGANGTATATDNCTLNGNITITSSDVTAAGACPQAYTITRTWRATDQCGNSSTCNQILQVIDNTPPSITCPSSLTVSCANNVPAPNPAIVTSSDNCSTPLVTFVSDVTTNQTCVNRYTLTRTYRATDACNNSATCTQTITVDDQTAPSLICPPNTTVTCASQVPAPNTSLVMAMDNCGTPTVTFVNDVTTNQTCVNRFTITRTYRATDACNNSATCTQTITVNDLTPPTITCPSPVTVSCFQQVPAPNPGSVTTSDNCGGTAPTVVFVSDVTINQVCPNQYFFVRTYRSTDACGNSAICQQTITVNDQIPPTLTCPPPTTVSCASQVPAPNIGSVTASDNCSGTPTITFVNDVTTNQTCVNRYTITRTYRATDACNNSATCTQTIVVNDQTIPSITCPAPVTVTCASQVPAPNTTSVTSSDNCGGNVTIAHLGDVTINQTCANRFMITRTYRATDACFNTATCTQIITVFDGTPPALTCPPAVTVTCASQVPAPNTGSVTASDNCNGTPTITFVSDVTTNQTCVNNYTITRTYRATDECQNSSTCTQTITVFDNSLPSITCPVNITVECAALVPAPNPASVTSTDNCGGVPLVTFVSDVTISQTCVNRYTIIRTYQASDGCNNTATCTQAIVVNDQTPPTITCPGPVTVSCASQVPAPNIGSVTASDNCNGTPTITFVNDVTTNQTCVNRYTITRTYRATDECSNSATCTQTITVNDQTPPTINCPANLTFSCATQVPAPNIATVTASDNCNGAPTVVFVNDVTTNQTCANRYTLTRTYRATDDCGNSATCTQVITINDQSVPTLTCPAGLTVTCSTDVPPANPGLVTATDNCNGMPTISFVDDVTSNQTCLNRYIVTRTYRATDVCGNSATCTQTIMVDDQVPPAITCPTNISVTCAELIPPVNLNEVTATDNCVGPVVISFVSDVNTNQECANRFTLVRTFRATDDCGNSATCSQLIFVNDQTPPSLTCPSPVTVSCANEVPAPDAENITRSDNCDAPVAVIFVGDVTTNQTCPNRYTLTRTYRATDACGNSTTCTQVITVFDNIPPQIECPDDITVNPESSTLPIVTGSPTGSDNCGGTPQYTYTETTTPGPCITDYFIHRTWTAMDACGNSSTCLQEIAVQGGCVVDLELDKSLAAGQDININPGDDISFTIRITNNGNVFIGSVSIVDYIPLGFTLNDVDWIAGTAGSTGLSASIELSIANGLLPLIGLAPGAFVDVDITLKSDDNLTGGTYINTAEISGMRNLLGMDVSNSDIDSDPDTDDTNDPPAEDDIDPLVFCIIIDPVIMGEDMVCQGDTTTYTIESFNPEHTYQWSVGVGGFIISSTDSSITVVWTADPGTLITIELLEIAGEECQFSTVFDVIIGGAEAIACFDHINLSISNDCGTQILSGMILTGIQHGDNSYQVFVIDMTTGDTIPNATVNCTHVGKTFKVSVRSKCTGQSCWGLVTIEDKSPPIINCFCPAGEEPNERCRLSCLVVDQLLNGIIPDNVRPQIVDECCGTTLELTNVDLSFADCSNGYVEISWLATDAFGNTATCVQAFDVVPLNIAGIVWPQDYVGDCDDSDDPENTGYPQLNGLNLLNGIVQSCNIWTQYDDQVVPICGDGRKIIRRWMVTNMCNAQTANYIQTIVLKDRVGPVLTCVPDFTVTTDVWSCYANIIMPKPLAVDACSDVKTFQLFSSGGTVVETGGQFRINSLPIGIHNVTWIVTDECYNQSTCSIQITVRDNVPPVVSCQAHTVVSLTNDRPNGITLVPASAFDAGSFDNCSDVYLAVRRMTSCIDIDWTTNGACLDDTPNGALNGFDWGTLDGGECIPVGCCDVGNPFMVQLAVWDASGNVNYCMVEVEVQDKLKPVVTCPPTLEISCEFLLDIQEGTFSDVEGNNDGTLDEDPLSEIFGNVYDAFRHDPGERQSVIINDPDNNQSQQPFNWGLEGWASDNCELELTSIVSVLEDCSGNSFPGFAPDHAVKLIERRITASDGVNTSSCLQRIWVIDYHPFFIADTTCENENPDDGVIWPCDVLITNCPEEISGTGEPIILDDGCSIIGISHEDTQFDFAEGACFKILREWKVIDWCQYDVNTGYGLWTYTQTIKVADQVGPEFLACPAEPVSYCTNDPGITLPANNQLFLGENNPDASSCSVHVNLHQTVSELCSPEVIYDVKLYLFNGPDFIQIKPETTASVNANHEADLYFDTQESGIPSIVLNGLPYNDPFCEDFHRLLWSVEDGCGNRTYCDYLFRLEDCKKPTPVCIDGISTAVMGPNGEVTVFAANFNASSVDDCTPSGELVFSFDGDTFQPSFTFTCDNVPAIGTPFDIEMWAADGGSDLNCNGTIEWSERNKDFCTASLLITDPNGVCDENGLVLVGEIMTDHVEAVSDVSVKLTGPESNAPVYVTEDDGKYTFTGVKEGLDYNISAERNDDPKNGVSTLDLVAIQKHLLGLETFTSASQYIAADASNNGSVSAIDLIEIRKLILGLYDQFPNNQSWRFVKKEVAENPGSPWPLTEIISLYSLEANENTSFDFVGIKVGDVNNTAKAHFTQIMPRNAKPVMKVAAVVNEEIRKGGVIDCKFTIPRVVEGFQWTLETKGLEYLGIKSTSIPIDDSHVGVLKNGVLTMSWNGDPVQGNEDPQSLSFILQFRVSQEGQLKDMLEMNSSVTLAEAYTQYGEVLEPKLEIDENGLFTDFALYQNKPNPWDDQTLIEFDLPYDGPAKLTVYDVAGKVVKQVEAEYKAGHNYIMLTERDIPTPGVLYYRLDSGEFSAVKKMMIFH